MDCNKGKYDKQEEVEGASLAQYQGEMEYWERIGYTIMLLPKYDLNKCPVAHSNQEVISNTKNKDIPDVFQMIVGSDNYTNYSKFDYEIDLLPRNRVWQKVSWNTRCKPVAIYTSFIDSKTINNTGTYPFQYLKGSSTMQSWLSETTACAGLAFKGADSSALVTTGFNYETIYTEQSTTGWSETLTKGDYMLYQNKVVYVFEISIAESEKVDTINESLKSAWLFDKSAPKTYVRGGRLFYFVDFNKNDPFIKPLSSNLYQTVTIDDVADYLLSDQGWWRW